MSRALDTCPDIDSRGHIHSPKSFCALASLGVFSLHEGGGGRGLCVMGRPPGLLHRVVLACGGSGVLPIV